MDSKSLSWSGSYSYSYYGSNGPTAPAAAEPELPTSCTSSASASASAFASSSERRQGGIPSNGGEQGKARPSRVRRSASPSLDAYQNGQRKDRNTTKRRRQQATEVSIPMTAMAGAPDTVQASGPQHPSTSASGLFSDGSVGSDAATHAGVPWFQDADSTAGEFRLCMLAAGLAQIPISAALGKAIHGAPYTNQVISRSAGFGAPVAATLLSYLGDRCQAEQHGRTANNLRWGAVGLAVLGTGGLSLSALTTMGITSLAYVACDQVLRTFQPNWANNRKLRLGFKLAVVLATATACELLSTLVDFRRHTWCTPHTHGRPLQTGHSANATSLTTRSTPATTIATTTPSQAGSCRPLWCTLKQDLCADAGTKPKLPPTPPPSPPPTTPPPPAPPPGAPPEGWRPPPVTHQTCRAEPSHAERGVFSWSVRCAWGLQHPNSASPPPPPPASTPAVHHDVLVHTWHCDAGGTGGGSWTTLAPGNHAVALPNTTAADHPQVFGNPPHYTINNPAADVGRWFEGGELNSAQRTALGSQLARCISAFHTQRVSAVHQPYTPYMRSGSEWLLSQFKTGPARDSMVQALGSDQPLLLARYQTAVSLRGPGLQPNTLQAIADQVTALLAKNTAVALANRDTTLTVLPASMGDPGGTFPLFHSRMLPPFGLTTTHERLTGFPVVHREPGRSPVGETFYAATLHHHAQRHVSEVLAPCVRNGTIASFWDSTVDAVMKIAMVGLGSLSENTPTAQDLFGGSGVTAGEVAAGPTSEMRNRVWAHWAGIASQTGAVGSNSETWGQFVERIADAFGGNNESLARGFLDLLTPFMRHWVIGNNVAAPRRP